MYHNELTHELERNLEIIEEMIFLEILLDILEMMKAKNKSI